MRRETRRVRARIERGTASKAVVFGVFEILFCFVRYSFGCGVVYCMVEAKSVYKFGLQFLFFGV